MLAEYQRIDREYPGPPIPPLDDLHEVEQIDSDGTIHLWNGDALVLAGLKCDHPDHVRYLRAVFLSESRKQPVYQLTGQQIAGRKLAYIWEVERGQPTKVAGIRFGPSTSSLNETVLSSGWCSPIEQDGHRYHARYEQLARMATRP